MSLGIAQDHTEAHAAAAEAFIMVELSTKEDLRTALKLQTLQMTARLGGLIAGRFVARTGALTALIRLT